MVAEYSLLMQSKILLALYPNLLMTQQLQAQSSISNFLEKFLFHFGPLSYFCIIQNFLLQSFKHRKACTLRKTSTNVNKFCNDLVNALSPLLEYYLFSYEQLTHSAFNNKFGKLINAISTVIDKHAHLQTAFRKQKRMLLKPWLMKGLFTSIKNKQKMYRCCKSSDNAVWITAYKKYSIELTLIKNLSKKMYYEQEIQEWKNNPKELWKLSNSVIPNKCTSNPPLTKLIVDNKVFEDPVDITKEFNNYFVKIWQTISNQIFNTPGFEFKSYLKYPIPKTIVH